MPDPGVVRARTEHAQNRRAPESPASPADKQKMEYANTVFYAATHILCRFFSCWHARASLCCCCCMFACLLIAFDRRDRRRSGSVDVVKSDVTHASRSVGRASGTRDRYASETTRAQIAKREPIHVRRVFFALADCSGVFYLVWYGSVDVDAYVLCARVCSCVGVCVHALGPEATFVGSSAGRR